MALAREKAGRVAEMERESPLRWASILREILTEPTVRW